MEVTFGVTEKLVDIRDTKRSSLHTLVCLSGSDSTVTQHGHSVNVIPHRTAAVTMFLWSEGMTLSEIYRRMLIMAVSM